MDSSNPTNQRQFVRVDYETKIDLGSDDGFYTGLLRNISNGGVFVSISEPPPPGTRLNIRFALPTIPEPVTAEVEVRWIRQFLPDSPDLLPGMGLQFLDLPADVAVAIDEFIQKTETLFYDE
jgi:uncharacterized protein (TIGR02266 family)